MGPVAVKIVVSYPCLWKNDFLEQKQISSDRVQSEITFASTCVRGKKNRFFYDKIIVWEPGWHGMFICNTISPILYDSTLQNRENIIPPHFSHP